MIPLVRAEQKSHHFGATCTNKSGHAKHFTCVHVKADILNCRAAA